MAKTLHKLMSILIAFVVLASTMSVTVNMHYCGGHLVETSFYSSTKGCGMEVESPLKQKCSLSNSNCCQDKELIYKGQDQLQLSFEQDVVLPLFFNSPIYFSFSANLQDFEQEELVYEEYKPPLVVRRIYKIDETYLI